MCLSSIFRLVEARRRSAVTFSAILLWLICPALAAEGEEEKDRWVSDARAEWPVATSTIQMMGGKNSVVLQVGTLRCDWNSGALIIICDQNKWSFDSLRIFRLSQAWGEYKPFRLIPKSEDEKERFMLTLREVTEALKRELPVVEEAAQAVGGVPSSGGCLVLELSDATQFRQYNSSNIELKHSRTQKCKEAIEIIDWWFRCDVSLLIGSDKIPQWNGKNAPRLPVESHFPINSKAKK